LKQFSLDNLTKTPNVLILRVLGWLLIALVAGQGPSLAYAACCGEGAAEMAEMACCCAESSCTAPLDDVVLQPAPRSNSCGCVEESAPLPAQTSAPADRSESNVSVLVTAASAEVRVANESTATTFCSHPPDAGLQLLESLRAVVLLI